MAFQRCFGAAPRITRKFFIQATRPTRGSGFPASYQLIWSNPPIRIGKRALHSLLTGWLSRLAPRAAAYLVVQRNLGSDSLQRWLGESGWDASRFAARAGYRVLEVRR